MMESESCTSNPRLICRICGDNARGVNFDVISCMSCKAFFRRHALEKSRQLRCQFDGHCNISLQTRKCCSTCRLQKCFSLGMNPQLIRRVSQTPSTSSRIRPKSSKKQKKIVLPQPTSLGLLHKDRSILTSDEWNLLSNIVHIYDAESVVAQTKYTIEQQSSLPPKMRFKTQQTLELIGSMYSAVQPFIERCPYFISLPVDVRRYMVQHNITTIGGLNTALVARESNLFADPAYRTTCDLIYGNELVANSDRLVSKLEQNTTLLKILIVIMAFSSNFSIVIPDPSKIIKMDMSVRPILITFQNIVVTMLWKYLVYQYGFLGAVHRFDCLIRTCLQVLKQTGENLSREHWDMVDVIVDETERLLTISD